MPGKSITQLVFIGLLMLIMAWTCQVYAGSDGPVGIAFKPDPPPDVDGDLSDWSQVPNAYELVSKGQVVHGNDMWEGNKDLSGKVWFAWREDYLYVAADVKDDILSQGQTGRDIWKGDNVEIYVDAMPGLEKDRTAFGFGQFHFGLSPGNFKKTGDTLVDLKPEAVVYYPPALSGREIIVSARKTESGYTIEAAIPWSMMAVKPVKNMEMGIEAAISDTDSSEPTQETLMVIQPKPWKSQSRERLLSAMLAGADGKAEAVVKSLDVFGALKVEAGQAEKISFNVPAKPANRESVLVFNARLDSKRGASGYTQAMVVKVNSIPLEAKRLINKQPQEERFSGEMVNMAGVGKFTTPYASDFDAPDKSDYGLKRAKFCLWEFRITDLLKEGDNTIEIENAIVHGLSNVLVTSRGEIEFRIPVEGNVKKGPPAGPIPTIIPASSFKVDYDVRKLGNDDILVWLNGERFVVESEFSTPESKWQKGSNRYFKFERRIEKLDEVILVYDTFTNLGNENLPIMQQHQARMNPKKVWLSGLSPASGKGSMSEPSNPTSFGITEKSGIGLMPLDDVFQVHIQNYADGDSIGIADRSFVLKPNASHTAEWAILPVAKPDYFAFVNAARRFLGTNFTIDGGFAFLRADPAVSKWSDEQIRSFIDYKSVKYLSIPVGYPKYKNVYAQGTAFQTVDHNVWKKEVQRRHRIDPNVKQLAYFHCFIDAVEGADKLYADSRTLRSDGTQANYRRIEYPIFFPTKENSYGKAVAKNVDIILDEVGLDGVYWDELEFSMQKYHYGQPWDGVSADIDLGSMKILRLKSSVTLLTQPWRLELAKKIMKRGVFVGNGASHTRTMAQLHFPRFVETGSISNCTRNQLFTPIALGDHLTERSETDAYKVMLKALDYGFVYYWYNDMTIIPTHHHLTKYMYPITPMELGEGFIIGKERIITNRSGVYGWDDDSEHEVHVFDDVGYEVKNFKVKTFKRDGKTFTELRMAEGFSAAIIRKTGKNKTDTKR